MEMKQESLSVKTIGPVKISVSLPNELRLILTVFTFAAACMEAYNASAGGISMSCERAFIWSATGFALVYTVLQHIFRMVSDKRASAVAVSVSAFLLVILLWNRELTDIKDQKAAGITIGMLAGSVYVLWLVLSLFHEKLRLDLILCVLADAVMVILYFHGGLLCADDYSGKAVYAALFALSAYYFIQFVRYRGRGRYPFVYFLIVMLLLMIIPSRKDPIDWTPVIKAAERAVYKTKEIGWFLTYYLPDLKSGSPYYTGYSTLDQTGGVIHTSDKTEIELKTKDNTSFTYTDEESGKKLKRRRTVYLTGGREQDLYQLLDMLFSMYVHGTDHEEAELFSRISEMDISYVYLKTPDEIIPVCPLRFTDDKGNAITGTEQKIHGKGYTIRAEYLDLDLGSPYLENIISSPEPDADRNSVSYEEMASYAHEVFGLNLAEHVSVDEYMLWQDSDRSFDKYLDTSGATERMRNLAEEITEGCIIDYESCRAVEAYLRKYAYRTDTGASGTGSTGSARGMSEMADGFLFDTGAGYCVHYASSMVMLLRLRGIPARYTTGYRYTFPFDRQEKYEVSSGSAHAWPQAYISGFGWVDFEPTSYYATAEERTWHRQPAAPAEEALKKDSYHSEPSVPAVAAATYSAEGEVGAAKSDGKEGAYAEAVRIVIIIVSAVVLTIAAIITGAWLFRTVRYKRAGIRDRLMMDVSDITGLIRLLSDMVVKDRGIMSDYDPYIPEQYRTEVRDAFDIYYRARYRSSGSSGDQEGATEDEGSRVRDLRNRMYREYRHGLYNVFRYR